MRRHACFALIASIALILATQCVAHADTPEDYLRQYVEELRATPSDLDLRQKLISFVRNMGLDPQLPDEVASIETAAAQAFKEGDYKRSASEYEKALLAAPWLARDYYNCALSHERAGNIDSAILNYNLFLLADPEYKDAREIRKHIVRLLPRSSKK